MHTTDKSTRRYESYDPPVAGIRIRDSARILSRYELTHRIGAGGMGEVFEARRITSSGIRGRVACKSMRRELRDDPRCKRFFESEAAVNLDLGRHHPNLVTVYECIEDVDGHAHIIMELIEGCSLHELLQLYREIEPEILRLIARDVLAALDHVHTHGLVHRDVSPCNVLISRTGEVKLSDLGLVTPANRRTRSNRFRGKLAYASPEAIRGESVDGRSDLFSFAAMMYEQITKQSPYGDDDGLWGMMRRLKRWRAPMLPREVDEDLRVLIMGLLHADRDKRRPQSAREALTLIGMDKAEKTRAQLAEMADTVYGRALERRVQEAEIVGAVVSQRRGDVDGSVDVDAHADTDTTPDGISVSESERTTETASMPGNEKVRTAHNRHVRAHRARRHRKRLVLAFAGLLGVLAVGRYMLDRGHTPESAASLVIASEPDTPAEHVIGPHHLMHVGDEIAPPDEPADPAADEEPRTPAHEDTASMEQSIPAKRIKRIRRGRTRAPAPMLPDAPEPESLPEPEPAVSTPTVDPRPEVAGFALQRLAIRPPDLEFTPPPGND